VVSAIAEGERPAWGCDDLWRSNPPDLRRLNASHCAMVTAILVVVDPLVPTPPWLQRLLDTFPLGCGQAVRLEGASPANCILR
jgi:hypothetical protein